MEREKEKERNKLLEICLQEQRKKIGYMQSAASKQRYLYAQWQQIDISSSLYCSPPFMDVTCGAIVIDYSFVCNME